MRTVTLRLRRATGVEVRGKQVFWKKSGVVAVSLLTQPKKDSSWAERFKVSPTAEPCCENLQTCLLRL